MTALRHGKAQALELADWALQMPSNYLIVVGSKDPRNVGDRQTDKTYLGTLDSEEETRPADQNNGGQTTTPRLGDAVLAGQLPA